MRAVVLKEHGGIDKFVYERDWRDPTIGPGDVLVRVRACALNYHDVFTRRGMPGIKLRLPLIVGNDLAGVVAAVGPEVGGFSIGDHVLVDPTDRVKGGFMGETFDGGLAELARLPAHMLIKLDRSVDLAQAASLPVAYGTAHRLMFERGHIEAGETVLILGSTGGVGTCCVQLAKMAGATVIACASSEAKLATAKALGADVGINYAAGDWVKECQRLFGKARVYGAGSGIDMVVNFTGGATWVPSLKVLRRGGRIVTCGATAGYDPPEDIRYIWTFELNIIGSNGWSRQDIFALLGLVEEGRLVPVLHGERFPLERAAAAMECLEVRDNIGKIIVEPCAA